MFLYTLMKLAVIPSLSLILYIHCKKESRRNFKFQRKRNITINNEYITSKSNSYSDRINELV